MTYDFDTGSPSLARSFNIPFEQTAGGVTARFSSPSGAASSALSDAGTGWKMSRFSGNDLYDNNPDRSTLGIPFSRPLSGIIPAFATADFEIEVPSTIQLTAYPDSAGTPAVSSAPARGAYAFETRDLRRDTMPMGTLTFNSGNRTFNRVKIVIHYQPQVSEVFFVNNTQVTGAGPGGVENVLATSYASGPLAAGAVKIDSVAPGLFTANFDRQGALAAFAVTMAPDLTQTTQPSARCGMTQGICVTSPIDLGPSGTQIVLALYGTWIRGRTSLAGVTAKIGGRNAQVPYAGAQPQFTGPGQVNVEIPRAVARVGETDLPLTVEGRAANAVSLNTG